MIPTVKIKTDAPDNEQGFVIINEEDFDPSVHEIFGETKPKKGRKAADPEAADEAE